MFRIGSMCSKSAFLRLSLWFYFFFSFLLLSSSSTTACPLFFVACTCACMNATKYILSMMCSLLYFSSSSSSSSALYFVIFNKSQPQTEVFHWYVIKFALLTCIVEIFTVSLNRLNFARTKRWREKWKGGRAGEFGCALAFDSIWNRLETVSQLMSRWFLFFTSLLLSALVRGLLSTPSYFYSIECKSKHISTKRYLDLSLWLQ